MDEADAKNAIRPPEPMSSGFAASAVATAVPEFGLHHKAHAATIAPTHDPEAGKGLGVALFILLLLGLVFNGVLPFVSPLCTVAAVVLGSVLSCGCCCAGDFHLKVMLRRLALVLRSAPSSAPSQRRPRFPRQSNVKTFSTWTLVLACVLLL